MDAIGKHNVSWISVRRLAIECHALDSAAYSLLNDSILNDKSGKNKIAYAELFTEKLLTLAIALRTKFYQGIDTEETEKYTNDCGLLYRLDGDREDGPLCFSFKDVCDKIIHADKIEKSIESYRDAEITSLYGREQRRGKAIPWRLSLSVTLFTECVLNWLEIKEER